MPVIANTLLHFTGSIETLKNILEYNFFPQLSLEDYSFLGNKTNDIDYQLFIPMVCFCDIPLHLINKHMNTYGSYGLGLSKEWGKTNRLNPVFYIEPNSILNEICQDILEKSVSNKGNFFSQAVQLMSYLKPYSGIDKINQHKIFYEEKEWRYVPELLDEKHSRKWVLKINSDENKINSLNNKLKEQPLVFTPTDIKYIFIERESEREMVIDMIRGAKIPNYCDSDIKILCSKIISSEQINDDI